MNRAARVAALVCGAALLAGCTGAGAAAPGTTRANPTTVAPPTTAAATTSAAPPTTTRAPTTTAGVGTTDDAQLRALHDRFVIAMGHIENLSTPSSVDGIATGIERQRLRESVARLTEQHLHTQGGIASRIIAVQVTDATHARVRACMRSTAVTFDDSGKVASRDPVTPRVTLLLAEGTAAGWRIADWFTGGNVPCEF